LRRAVTSPSKFPSPRNASLGEHELVGRPVAGLVGAPAEQVLRARVPVGDATVRIGRDHRHVDLVEQRAARRGLVLGTASLRDVVVHDDDACRSGPFEPRGAQDVPAALVGGGAGVLERQLVAGAGGDLAQPGGHGGRDRIVVGVAHRHVARARARVRVVLGGRHGPGAVGHLDRPVLVEDDDLRGQRVERRLQEVACAGDLLASGLLLGDVLRGAVHRDQAPLVVADRARPVLVPQGLAVAGLGHAPHGLGDLAADVGRAGSADGAPRGVGHLGEQRVERRRDPLQVLATGEGLEDRDLVGRGVPLPGRQPGDVLRLAQPTLHRDEVRAFAVRRGDVAERQDETAGLPVVAGQRQVVDRQQRLASVGPVDPDLDVAHAAAAAQHLAADLQRRSVRVVACRQAVPPLRR
jgi:hypothetical protein